ncbi:MAG: hypothetical protein RL413_1126 [Actinomycetota bacterium]
MVPTMGALHAGHVSLMQRAHALGARVVVSIFVNPLQFGDATDLAKYPSDVARDIDICREANVDLVWAPSVHDMYPAGFATRVSVDGVSEPFEGRHRPGHFEGVATVVTKLFAVIRPDVAVFGAKDFQQVAVVKRLTADLGLPVDIDVAPTVRDHDGLALSSRNVRLDPEARARASVIPRSLVAAEKAWHSGVRNSRDIEAIVAGELIDIDIDYASVVDPSTLAPRNDDSGPAVVLIAATVGGVRLIDNVVLT